MARLIFARKLNVGGDPVPKGTEVAALLGTPDYPWCTREWVNEAMTYGHVVEVDDAPANLSSGADDRPETGAARVPEDAKAPPAPAAAPAATPRRKKRGAKKGGDS